jgi:hypothetical protein
MRYMNLQAEAEPATYGVLAAVAEPAVKMALFKAGGGAAGPGGEGHGRGSG